MCLKIRWLPWLVFWSSSYQSAICHPFRHAIPVGKDLFEQMEDGQLNHIDAREVVPWKQCVVRGCRKDRLNEKTLSMSESLLSTNKGATDSGRFESDATWLGEPMGTWENPKTWKEMAGKMAQPREDGAQPRWAKMSQGMQAAASTRIWKPRTSWWTFQQRNHRPFSKCVANVFNMNMSWQANECGLFVPMSCDLRSLIHWGKEEQTGRNAWWMAAMRKVQPVSNWSTLIQPHDFYGIRWTC